MAESWNDQVFADLDGKFKCEQHGVLARQDIGFSQECSAFSSKARLDWYCKKCLVEAERINAEISKLGLEGDCATLCYPWPNPKPIVLRGNACGQCEELLGIMIEERGHFDVPPNWMVIPGEPLLFSCKPCAMKLVWDVQRGQN